MKKKLPFILLILIIFLAAFLRLYRIGDYQTFLGDEGRDVLVAKGILEGNFTLLGPRSSAGDFFMGPVYYYMITPWLWLFRFDPVGPAVMVAILSIITVWFMYYVGRRWFGTTAGLMSAALYAVSPIVITYSHSSWNPDVLPFFALLMMYMLYLGVQAKEKTRYFIFIGFLLGISLQLHYIALLLGVIIFLYTLWADWYNTKRLQVLVTLRHYLQIIIGFLVGFSPFLAFEIRHGFPNTKSIFQFIFGDTTQKGYETGGTFFSTIADVFFRVFAKLVFYFPSPDRYHLFSSIELTLFGAFAMLLSFAAIVVFFRRTKNIYTLVLVGLWLIVGIGLFGFYKKQIYDYNFVYLFPLPFLIIGNFLGELSQWSKKKKQQIVGVVLSIALFGGIFYYNFTGMPFWNTPNRQKNQAKTIAQAIIDASNNQPYNFALISKGNSDHAYRYFLDILGHPPIMLENTLLDPERKSVTGQLLVVCEDVSCEPLGHSLFDVAGFGRAEVVGEWDVSVVKVYRLVPYEEK